jgi:dolichyl-phosphate beta-glucosyltransferase
VIQPFGPQPSSFSPDLTVVVPAYNEEARLSVMLDDTLAFLESQKGRQLFRTFEIVIVDDGSKDKTSSIANAYFEKHCAALATSGRASFRVLQLSENRGKGHAVKAGVMAAKGRYILFADADGATKMSDLAALYAELSKPTFGGRGLVLGSRAHLVKSETVVKRSVLRNILMYGFHMLVSLAVRGIEDTQCGFKLMDAETGKSIFGGCHIDRWGFDIELLYRAQRMGVVMKEMPVNWTEIEGSKLNVASATVAMARDVICVPLLYRLGIWKLHEKSA